MSRTLCRLDAKALLCLLPLLTACAGTGPNSSPSTLAAPAILAQPRDLSLPMGVSGAFSVRASGDNLQYQWSRGGTPIAGATAGTYTTPIAAFAEPAPACKATA